MTTISTLRSWPSISTYRSRMMSSLRNEIEYGLNASSVKVSVTSTVLTIVTPVRVSAPIIR